MKTTYETLEMNMIQDHIQTYCASSLGKQRIANLAIFDDLEDLDEALIKTHEAMRLLTIQGRVPFGGLSDISLSLEKVKKDMVLSGGELLKIAYHLECLTNVKNYIYASEINIPHLHALCDGLVDNPSLLQDLHHCLLPDGSLADHASDALFLLRKKIQNLQVQIRSKMESLVKDNKDMLSIDQMTTKNDRLVLPVKTGYRHQLGGLVHAQSATGQTAYVEPEAVVIMNNELCEHQLEERAEVERILKRLSVRVNEHYYHFHFNQDILEDLDFVFAKGQYGVYMDSCIPTVQESGSEIALKKARHPLLDPKKVIANDILLKDQRMLLISGSNTGGKTVALKTMGLLSLMALCGLPVPCSEATLPFFDNIYVDLGDEQSIEQSLSTFSSHMTKIITILSQATSRSLVILDEIGSGTDPQEGESLAEAILAQFLRSQSFVFASTHYGRLKTFAKEQDNILLASVGFDLVTMRPTYRLQLDSVGQSYAIEIAALLGLDKEIVDEAQKIKESAMSEHEKLMEELEKRQDQINIHEEKLAHLLTENKSLKQQYQRQIETLEKQKEQLVKQAQDDANHLVLKAKKQIDHIVETMKSSTLKQHEIIDAKHQLDQLQYHEKEVLAKQEHSLTVGDHVKIIKMGREGNIVEILKNHRIMVSLDGLHVKLHEDEVQFMHAHVKVKTPKIAVKKAMIKKTGTYEINVIGKRFEEAMELVDKFLDDALVSGYPHVRIVHGMGTGVLRKGVHKMLDRNKHVTTYRNGGPNEGGLGVTLVYFE